MNVTVRSTDPQTKQEVAIPREYKVTEVILQHDPEDPTKINMFRCDSCGKELGQYSGFIFRKIPEGSATNYLNEHPVVILYCKLCKRRYLMNNIL